MALGTYDRDERKKKVVYNADGTTNEEKADRSVVAAAPVQEEALKPNLALATAMPVTQTPQAQMKQQPQVQQPLTPLDRKPKLAGVSDEVTPQQNAVTNQESQSNVNSGGEIKNNQGEVKQGTDTFPESQVGPASDAGGENMQWAGAPQDDVTSTYNNIINPPQATPPLNAPVREFGGFNFSTVTPTGNTLSDADMDAYFNMLKKASENTGESIEDLDKKAGGLLVGKSQQATAGTSNGNTGTSAENPQQDTTKKNAEGTGNGSTGSPTNTNGTKKVTVANNANTAATSTGSTNNGTTGTPSKNTASTTTAPAVLTSEDYAKFSPSVLQTMAEIERDPMKKAMMQKAMQMQAQGASQPTAGSGATSTAGTATNPPTGATATKPRKFSKRQQARKDEAAQKMSNKDVYNGNVDLLSRPSVDSKTMQAAGYTEIPDGSYASVYSMQNGFRDKSKKGKVREILYTPIMADGTVLSQKDVDKYLTDLGKKGDILELDKPEKGGKGLVIAADVKGDLGPELHELQESYYSTPEDYAAKGKDAETRITSLGGNQNPLSQKPVTKQEMVDAGWSAFSQYPDDEIYAHPIQQIIVDSNGKEHKVIMTPITKDGDILSPEQFDAYVSSLQENPDIMGADRSDSGLILKYDADDGDATSIYDDIFAWRLGQSEKDETQGKALGNTYKDDTERRLAEDIERAQKDIDAQNERIRKFVENPDSDTRGGLAIKARDDKLKEEGLDEESEKRIEKRRKTSNIIANIGDILQGFANLAGTWYGAKSSDLTSLSAASQAGDEKVDAKRKARRDEIMKSYEKSISSLGEDMQKELTRLNKIMERAQDRYMNYISSTGKTELRYQRSEEKAQRDAERRRKEQDRKEQYQRERDKEKAKAQAERDKRNHEYRVQEKQYGAHMSAWAKAQPTYGQLHPQSKNGGSKSTGGTKNLLGRK